MPYLEELSKLRYEVHVLSDKEESIDFADKNILGNFKKNFFSLNNIKEIIKIQKILKEEKYETVIVHTTLASMCVRLAAKFLKDKPKIIYMCHGYLFTDKFSVKNKIYLLLEKFVANITDKLIVMNSADLKIANKYKLGKNIFFTDGVGIDLNKFQFNDNENDKKRYREKFSLGQDDIIFLNVAEFSKRKNQRELIFAWSKIDNPKIKLVFAGVGKELEKCKKLVKKLNIEENVYFLGYIKNIYELYVAADYYISSSKSEGMPFSVLEAASTGLPLVLSNKKGHKDIIKNTRGLVYNNRKDIVQKIYDLLIYKKKKNMLGKYDLLKVKDNILKIYTDK